MYREAAAYIFFYNPASSVGGERDNLYRDGQDPMLKLDVNQCSECAMVFCSIFFFCLFFFNKASGEIYQQRRGKSPQE